MTKLQKREMNLFQHNGILTPCLRIHTCPRQAQSERRIEIVAGVDLSGILVIQYRQPTKRIRMLILSFFAACSEKDPTPNNTDSLIEDTAEEIVEDTAEDIVEEPLECSPLSVSVQWTPEHFSISFDTYDELGSYYLGIAQTETAAANKWTGEDCHLGFVHEEEHYSYCHPARTGINLIYGATYEEIIEGYSTHFSGPEFENEVTYIIKEAISGCCWSWGGSPEYYQDLSCLPL